jgi:NAD(P)-dependent dehydrogenase (short-subunit alcohol dehydrogenase family)
MNGIAEQTGMSDAEIETGQFANQVSSSLLLRLAAPGEIANLIIYLAGPLASVTNGDAVRAEGGIMPSFVEGPPCDPISERRRHPCSSAGRHW